MGDKLCKKLCVCRLCTSQLTLLMVPLLVSGNTVCSNPYLGGAVSVPHFKKETYLAWPCAASAFGFDSHIRASEDRRVSSVRRSRARPR